MKGACLNFENPIEDAVSRIRFAPQSNNLLISSWDSNLRLYDVDSSLLRLEAPAPSQAALLDCCFQSESVAFTAASDGSITRYDLHSGTIDAIGNHQDMATCVGYSIETCQVISAGLDKKVMSWDMRLANPPALFRNLGAEIDSISISGFDLMVAVGAAVNIYDLRNYERAVDLKELSMDVGISCVASVPFTRGYAIGLIDGRVALEISNPLNSNSTGYTFRCHPTTKDGTAHLVSVNDMVFNPLIGGTFVTGDNEGYVTAWDAKSKRRLHEFPRYPNSVASLSYNHVGQLLAVVSSYTYQEANEREVSPQIFIQKMEDSYVGFSSEVSRSIAAMSDEEHHFESKADAGASKTYPQQAGTIRKNGYIVIKNRPCKVVEVSTSKTGKHGHAKCHFVAIDIFNGKKLEDIVPSSHNCDVPHVTRTDYQLIDISEDGFVSLLTENGNTKDDLKLPTDDSLLTQIKDGFGEGKDLVVTVMSSMGEEQICALKDIGPK
ncbi:mitotic checkpoint protein BUB3.3-like [Populus nigra]|uniref:mitotic checkpoint protein BUB3.3-like n=1 Tax=Populus nigra TaxID=3691 RepID=UPI002B274A8D|nr:mitotic checkpoint protein BUB3.3-like [Populus nigra]